MGVSRLRLVVKVPSQAFQQLSRATLCKLCWIPACAGMTMYGWRPGDETTCVMPDLIR